MRSARAWWQAHRATQPEVPTDAAVEPSDPVTMAIDLGLRRTVTVTHGP